MGLLGGAGAGRVRPVLWWDPRLPSSRPFPLTACPEGPPLLQLVCPQELCTPDFCRIHWLSSLFPSRPFKGPSPDLIRGPFLGMILLCLPSALSVAFKCPSLSLNLQTFCGVGGNSVGFGLFFGHRSLEACRILSPGTAPGVGHMWFQFVFVDFMVLCICSFFIVDLFLKSLLNLLQYCFHFVFWCFGCQTCRLLAPQPRIKPTLLCTGRARLSRCTAREDPILSFLFVYFWG